MARGRHGAETAYEPCSGSEDESELEETTAMCRSRGMQRESGQEPKGPDFAGA